MRRLLAVALLLAGLCAPPAVLAQIGGSAGVTSPSSSNVFATTVQAGTTATYDPLVLSPQPKGAGAFTGTFTTADLTANRTFTFPNVSGTALIYGTNTIASTSAPTITLSGATGTPGLVLIGQNTATNAYARFTMDTGTGVALTSYDGTNSSTLTVLSTGLTFDRYSPSRLSVITSGYGVFGLNAAVPLVNVVVTDPGSDTTIASFTAQVCGYATQADSAIANVTCTDLALGSPPIATDAGSWYFVTALKTHTFTGAIGDEQISLAFDGGSSILAATQLLDNSTPSATSSLAGPYNQIVCLDLLGCTGEVNSGMKDGAVLTTVGATGTNPITWTTGGVYHMNTAGPFVQGVGDVLVLTVANSGQVYEVSRSDN